jgi:hypothetical protein
VDGEIIALNLKSGQYYTLNEVGTRMWTLLVQLGSVESTVAAIVTEYDISQEQVEQDLASLLEALAVNGLVEKN